MLSFEFSIACTIFRVQNNTLGYETKKLNVMLSFQMLKIEVKLSQNKCFTTVTGSKSGTFLDCRIFQFNQFSIISQNSDLGLRAKNIPEIYS